MKIWSESVVYRDRKSPLIQRGRNLESEFPWRTGVGLIVRFPLSRRAFSFGWWNGEQPRENIDGFPSLSLRPLDHPEDYFHVLDQQQDERPAF